jgi:hypothetical protein
MNHIPSTIINEPYQELSLLSLQNYLRSIKNEIDSLMEIYPNVPPAERKAIADRTTNCYKLYEELYSYYLPLFNEWKLNIVRQLIRESTVFEKYRQNGIIR